MKQLRLITYALLPVILCTCEADPHWQHLTLTYSDSITTGWNTADICLHLDEQSNAVARRVEIGYSLYEDVSSALFADMALNGQGQWTAQLTDLQDSSLYYLYYHVTPSFLQPESAISSFLTMPLPPPDVTTKAATDITATTAVLHGSAQKSDGNESITERGFYYSLLPEGGLSRKQVKCSKGAGVYEARIEALRANATYYFVAYAINKHGIAYGDTLKFDTLNPYKQ